MKAAYGNPRAVLAAVGCVILLFAIGGGLTYLLATSLGLQVPARKLPVIDLQSCISTCRSVLEWFNWFFVPLVVLVVVTLGLSLAASFGQRKVQRLRPRTQEHSEEDTVELPLSKILKQFRSETFSKACEVAPWSNTARILGKVGFFGSLFLALVNANFLIGTATCGLVWAAGRRGVWRQEKRLTEQNLAPRIQTAADHILKQQELDLESQIDAEIMRAAGQERSDQYEKKRRGELPSSDPGVWKSSDRVFHELRKVVRNSGTRERILQEVSKVEGIDRDKLLKRLVDNLRQGRGFSPIIWNETAGAGENRAMGSS